MDGEEKGETDQRARDERKYRTGQVRWTQMMRKREMCTGEDTGELEESREGREGTEREQRQELVPPAACCSLMHNQHCVSSQPCD